jgi:hypothetical protein
VKNSGGRAGDGYFAGPGTVRGANDPRLTRRIWPKDRIEARAREIAADHPIKVERLQGGLRTALGWAAYFSLLSAFHIGFREFNVGTWLSRLQAHEYALKPVGWVRVVSGAQSLISVYLLAIWALTYFGRPFQ